MSIPYLYTKTPVAIDRLTQEIQRASFVTSLDYVSGLVLSGSDLTINFIAALSDTDKASLDALVAAHSGVPLPSNASTPVSVVNQPTSFAISSTPAFASKTFGTKSLFKRVVGQQASLSVGDNTIMYTETFPWVKFMALEIIGGDVGDYVSLYILDRATGPIYGTPNMQLNQFGFNANIGAGYYEQKSEFDADLYAGLQIKIVYHSISAKVVGINYVMNEVK